MGSLFPLDVCVAFSLIPMGTICTKGAADPMFHCVCRMPHGISPLGHSDVEGKGKEGRKSEPLRQSQGINSRHYSQSLTDAKIIIIVS